MQFEKTDLSRVDWPAALLRLGLAGEYLSRPASSKKCPMHPENGKTKFRFLKPVERGRWVCNDCGIGDSPSLLMKLNGWDFRTFVNALQNAGLTIQPRENVASGAASIQSVEDAARSAHKRKKDFETMRRWWRAAKNMADDTPARRYLERRVARIDTTHLGADVRAHDGLPYFEDSAAGAITRSQHPALIGLMRDAEGRVKMMQRIYLTPNGEKALVGTPKKVYSPEWVNGCAIRVGVQEQSPVIGIAEGLEKACAIYRACEQRFPIWAVGGTHGVTSLQLPAWVERVHIFADNDLPTAAHPQGAGQEAAFRLRDRLQAAGVEVVVHIAAHAGGDHEDDWNERAALQHAA